MNKLDNCCSAAWEPIDIAIELDIILDEQGIRVSFEKAQEIIAAVHKAINELGTFHGEEDVRKEILKALEVEDE